MKKLLMVLAISSVFAACKSNSDSDLPTNRVILSDTSGLNPNSASGDTSTSLQRGERPLPESRTYENSSVSTRPEHREYSSRSETRTTTRRRRGWSGRAKGAVIGGAAGAVGGALISRHKGTGAVVGGLAGAAGGYIIGNESDKKSNR